MSAYAVSAVRDVVLLGHSGAGKTTLAEALLHRAGRIGSPGQVEKGNTVSDHTEEDRSHGHSLSTSLLHCDHEGVHINLVDTPGMPDFLGPALSGVVAADTALIVIDAVGGIEPTTRRLMQLCAERGLCRMVVVNKIDSPHANLPQLVEQIQATFGKACLPINLPAGGGERVVDCFFQPSGESDFGSVEQAHTNLVEQVVEVDEELMAVYLEQGEELSADQLHEPFEQALREGHLIPICFTAARPHERPESPVGVGELLDVLVKLAPNPGEGNPPHFYREDDPDNEIHPQPDPKGHVLAHVFDVRSDAFAGKLSVFRIYQGTVRKDTQLYIGDPEAGESKKPVRVGHLFRIQGGQHEEIDEAGPGDIAAVSKVEQIHRDAVLHDSHDEDRVHLKPLPLPQPMQGLAITPKKRGDEQKIADALSRLVEEDPCFKVSRDGSTRETVIHGLGDLHLRVMLERLEKRFNVAVETKPPRIAYRETITKEAAGHHRHKKQTGGAGQFGEVYLRVEPLERGAGFEFVDEIVGGTIPNQFVPAVEKGVRQVLEEGALAGYPIQDVRVRVYDGKHHPVDSKEVAFVTAGRRAFLDAFEKASPVLLEPIAKVEITVPQGMMGDVTGDLSGRRGRIQGTDVLPGDQALISALVPLSEMGQFQNQLNSMTGGQGSFAMHLSHYDPAPSHVQEQVVAQYKPAAEAE